MAKEKKKEKLNPKRELFCQLYTSQDVEMFGNGVQAYIEAYNIDVTKKGAYNTAKANAHRLLTNAYVVERINELLEMGGFNDENVKKQHLFLLNQHANLPVKQKAVDSYYKLKGKNKEKENTIVIPIYAGESNNISRHSGDKEDISAKEED